MKNVIWIILALLIVGVGYMLFSGKSAQDLAEEASRAVNAPALLEDASEAASDAAAVVEEAVDASVEATADVVDSAVAAGEEAAQDAADATAAQEESAEETPAAEPASAEAEAFLTIEGFDRDRAVAAIEQSDLTAEAKQEFIARLDAAADNPEELEPVLAQLRAALGR